MQVDSDANARESDEPTSHSDEYVVRKLIVLAIRLLVTIRESVFDT